jgi:hypothetical protein
MADTTTQLLLCITSTMADTTTQLLLCITSSFTIQTIIKEMAISDPSRTLVKWHQQLISLTYKALEPKINKFSNFDFISLYRQAKRNFPSFMLCK